MIKASRCRRQLWRACLLGVLAMGCVEVPTVRGEGGRHNVIIFVADGLRHGAVDTGAMPTFVELRHSGVDFVNSHSLFPTVTTPNASAIATGHYLGDTGNFGNTMFLGFPARAGSGRSATHNIEDNVTIADLCAHYGGSYLGEETLLSAARRAGLHTAVIGKLGPALVQDVTRNYYEITAENVGTVVIDDNTGAGQSRTGERWAVPLPVELARRIASDAYFKSTYFEDETPTRDPRTAPRGANNSAGTRVANVAQQRYLIDTLTRAVLPSFVDPKGDHKQFVIVYWSRDPDGTQHNQRDGTGLVPGINGETVKKAFANVDGNLKQLVDYLKNTPDPNTPSKMLMDTTDIFITSDHGFSTVSRGLVDAQGTRFQSFATRQRYADVDEGMPPRGFLAIDLAHDLGLPLYDADTVVRTASESGTATAPTGDGLLHYKQLRIESTATQRAEHPVNGAGMIGGAGTCDKDGYSTDVVVVPTGGSALIYVPPPHSGGNGATVSPAALMQRVVSALLSKPYVSGVFVDTSRFGRIPGSLALTDINFVGSARTMLPAAIISFRSFSTDPAHPEMTGVVLADAGEKQGQGSHGSFGRQDTYNCMMAIGPDFKPQFSDPDPVSNADIAITLSQVLGIELQTRGLLHGRNISEALMGGAVPRGSKRLQKISSPGAEGITTVMLYQTYTDDAGHSYDYFDAGGFAGASVGLPSK